MKFAGGQEVIHLKSDVLIKDLVEDQIQKRLEQERLALAESGAIVDDHSTDLIPGVYEGNNGKGKRSHMRSARSGGGGGGGGGGVGVNGGRRQRRGGGPMSKKRDRKLNEQRHPWFNKEMADLIKRREKAHKKWLSNDKRAKGDANWEVFKKIRNQVSTLRHATRNEFLVAALKVDGFSSAQPWQTKGIDLLPSFIFFLVDLCLSIFCSFL